MDVTVKIYNPDRWSMREVEKPGKWHGSWRYFFCGTRLTILNLIPNIICITHMEIIFIPHVYKQKSVILIDTKHNLQYGTCKKYGYYKFMASFGQTHWGHWDLFVKNWQLSTMFSPHACNIKGQMLCFYDQTFYGWCRIRSSVWLNYGFIATIPGWCSPV